jgi:NitT/TauT family transport system substrate-binding protein
MAMIGRRQLGLAALALPMLGRPARAEVATVRIAKQYGLPYLPIMVMEHERLVEKHAARLGLPALQTAWATLGGTGAIADGLISGQLDFAGAGANALLTLWDKTAGTGQEVLALSAIQSMPFLLMTSSTALHSVDDLSDADRIAVPAVKISAQALLLEMEAARRWGLDDYARLDRLTVSLPHPDALVGLLSGTSAVNCHYAVSPFYYYELASPKLRMILKSYDTFGSHHINGTLIGSKRFRDANPKVTEAVLAAQEEANELLNKHPDQAAAIYIEMAKDTRSSPTDMARMVADPDNDWTTTPAGVERMADFMQKTGRMRRTLTSWKQVYMPEVHGVAGS